MKRLLFFASLLLSASLAGSQAPTPSPTPSPTASPTRSPSPSPSPTITPNPYPVIASNEDGTGFVELREVPPSSADGAYLVVDTDTTSSFRMGSFSYRFEGDGTNGFFFIGDEGAASDEFNTISFGDIIAYSGASGAPAHFLAFGNDSQFFRSTATDGRVAYWSGSVPGFGAFISDDSCFTFDEATCTLTVTNISGSPSFSLVPAEVVFGGAAGEMDQAATFTYDEMGDTLTVGNVQAGSSVAVGSGAFYDIPEAANAGRLVFIGASLGEYVTDAGASYNAAGGDLTISDDVFAGGLVSSDLTAGGIPVIGTAGRIIYDPGILFTAASDLLDLGAGNITLAGAVGYVRVGTSTAANGLGDFSAGLTGSKRIDFDSASGSVTMKDSSDATRIYFDGESATSYVEARDTSGSVWRSRIDSDGNLTLRTAAAADVVLIGVSGNVFNDNGSASRNFRVESDTLTHAIFVDAATDRVGFNDSTPDADFDFHGGTESFQMFDSSDTWVLSAPDGDMQLRASGVDFLNMSVSTTPDEMRVNEDGADLDFVVEGVNRNVLVVDASINAAELFGVLSTEPAAATISSGAITITSSYVIVDTEGGAASDDLDNINAGTGVTLRQGMVLFLQQANDARDVTLRDGAGNIQCNANQTLTNAYAGYLLMYNGSVWCRIGGTNSN